MWQWGICVLRVWEGGHHFTRPSLASGCWVLSARLKGRDAENVWCLTKCSFSSHSLSPSLFSGTLKINTSRSFCIYLPMPVEAELRRLHKYFSRAAIWLSIVTACPPCPPVQVWGKNDDTVSDALCKIYALSRQRWLIYLFGFLHREISVLNYKLYPACDPHFLHVVPQSTGSCVRCLVGVHLRPSVDCDMSPLCNLWKSLWRA